MGAGEGMSEIERVLNEMEGEISRRHLHELRNVCWDLDALASLVGQRFIPDIAKLRNMVRTTDKEASRG